IGCFGPLKRNYNKQCQEFMRSNPGQKVTKYNVARLTGSAYVTALSPANLTSAFRKTGVYPFGKTVTPDQTAPSTLWNSIDAHSDKKTETVSTINSGQIDDTGHNVPHSDRSQDTNQNGTVPTNATTKEIGYLESITVVSVKNIGQRKRKSPNQITGRLNKKRNIKTLEETDRNKNRTANISTKKNTKKNNMNKKGNVATLGNKIPDPLPGPSHYHPIENFERLASSSDTESDLDDTETVCCHCEKFSPA
ncbi:hypothetical protein ScPMuIL_000563, partial [Solemya velum]